jgi:hypothetical protein
MQQIRKMLTLTHTRVSENYAKNMVCCFVCLVFVSKRKNKTKLMNPSCDFIIIIRLFFLNRNRTPLSFFQRFLHQYRHTSVLLIQLTSK